MRINRSIYFDSVRTSLFNGSMSKQQVDGQNAILDGWTHSDLRWLGYMLATTYHETAQKMWPIEENGRGVGQPYGVVDSETGQTYYGRGYVQLTWRDNYEKMTDRLNLIGADDLEWHAERALDPSIAFDVMDIGMVEGLFRPPHKLSNFFQGSKDDPYNARDIINGDKTLVPDWSGGVSIGNIIKGYYMKFTAALNEATALQPESTTVSIDIKVPEGITLQLSVNGMIIGV